MKDWEKLANQIKEWRRTRNVDNADRQLIHCFEEASEVGRLFLRDVQDKDEIGMEIGDMFVTTIILSDILDIDPYVCLERACDKISKRTGKTIKGNFVKSEDL